MRSDNIMMDGAHHSRPFTTQSALRLHSSWTDSFMTVHFIVFELCFSA